MLVAVSIAAGLVYPWLDGRIGPGADIALKGTGVAALAIAAALTSGANAKWLAAILGAGALGDVLLEVPGRFFFGAGAFAIGHVIAMIFYARHRRPALPVGDLGLAAGLVGFGVVMPALGMPAGAATAAPTLYAVLLCGMAAAAWSSGFARRWTAAGALLFVVSDTFLVMRLGGNVVGGPALHDLIVWYAYYVGQLMIFTGVMRGVRG